ncbi:hypothetical protein C8R44DRAFT_880562 [Mycena epipterygia]|nr:hypothetical protein C8R44DRAFT_880562 [Mycena epipterygia]
MSTTSSSGSSMLEDAALERVKTEERLKKLREQSAEEMLLLRNELASTMQELTRAEMELQKQRQSLVAGSCELLPYSSSCF